MIWYTCLEAGEILFAGISRLVGEEQGPGKEVNTFWGNYINLVKKNAKSTQNSIHNREIISISHL